MTLPARDRVRYSRQLLLPEIGGEGQARLLAARFSLRGEERVREVAALYLGRAGAGLAEEPGEKSEEGRALEVGDASALREVAQDPALEEAAAILLGSLAAVEGIKIALGRSPGTEGVAGAEVPPLIPKLDLDPKGQQA